MVVIETESGSIYMLKDGRISRFAVSGRLNLIPQEIERELFEFSEPVEIGAPMWIRLTAQDQLMRTTPVLSITGA